MDPVYEHYKYTNYVVRFSKQTKTGVRLDDSGIPSIDMTFIDSEVSALEECLGIKVKRCSVRVKIAPDWMLSEKGQYFPCNVPDVNFQCTGIQQYPAAIITTPNLASFRHELIHLVTQAQHGDPEFLCDSYKRRGSPVEPSGEIACAND